MSAENTEIVRNAIEMFLRGDVEEAMREYFDPDGEFVSRFGALEGGAYRGNEGAHRYFEDIDEAWESYERELEDVIDCGDAAVAIVTIKAVARTSGVPMERRIGIVLRVDAGRIIQIDSYPSLDEALTAARDGAE